MALRKTIFGYIKRPQRITDLSIGQIYNTAFQLLFTVPVSKNGIKRYDCYVGGVFKQSISKSGQFITNLNKNTLYSNISVVVVDNVNKVSDNSNSVNATTANINYLSYASTTESSNYISASGISALEDISSTEQIIYQLINKGLWNKIQAGYLFKGTTADNHKYNIKNPVDSDAAFRLVFFGSGVYSSLGYQLNGSNAYADTKFVPSVHQSTVNNGLTIVCGTNNAPPTIDTVEIGSWVSSSQESAIFVKRNLGAPYQRGGSANWTLLYEAGVDQSRGIYSISRQSTAVTSVFVTGRNVATGNSGGRLPNIPIFIGTLNINNAPFGISNQRIQLSFIHQGLTDGEMIQLYEIIDVSENLAGRKTW
ncbi:hypothetical protein LNQ49_12705 [Flavobacterium sp. F-65]|uniref:Uncharacterized protein n=1 Tax=Flavobacterium pisciphilum TaxID=2893755 RepID=A0ABS8MUH2_9FLAO|nr:hypothetical protein [Flavobacterium sp. F-65]MCC9072443.1 hypothetical protein [Flavobacterium sp. F-65]